MPNHHRSIRDPRLTALLLAAAAAAATLGACASRPSEVPYARPYPESLVQTDTLDVHVFRRATRLELTNSTPRTFGPSTLWLNGWYSKPIEGLEPGQTIVLNLRDFHDRYSEPFRAGGFFATRDPDKVVLAQLETPTPDNDTEPDLLGLVIVSDRPE